MSAIWIVMNIYFTSYSPAACSQTMIWKRFLALNSNGLPVWWSEKTSKDRHLHSKYMYNEVSL